MRQTGADSMCCFQSQWLFTGGGDWQLRCSERESLLGWKFYFRKEKQKNQWSRNKMPLKAHHVLRLYLVKKKKQWQELISKYKKLWSITRSRGNKYSSHAIWSLCWHLWKMICTLIRRWEIWQNLTEKYLIWVIVPKQRGTIANINFKKKKNIWGKKLSNVDLNSD